MPFNRGPLHITQPKLVRHDRPPSTECLVPAFGGAILSAAWKEALWVNSSWQCPHDRGGPSSNTKIVKRA
jgi:hypothetical protein